MNTELHHRDDERPEKTDHQEDENPADLLNVQRAGLLAPLIHVSARLRDFILVPPFPLQAVQLLLLLEFQN